MDIAADDPGRPTLLAVSDNGAQMTSGSTREFMALCAIATHFDRRALRLTRPGSSFNGHLKAEDPLLEKISDPAALRTELSVVRRYWNSCTSMPASAASTPDDEHEGRGPAIRKAREAGLEPTRLRGASPPIGPEASNTRTGT